MALNLIFVEMQTTSMKLETGTVTAAQSSCHHSRGRLRSTTGLRSAMLLLSMLAISTVSAQNSRSAELNTDADLGKIVSNEPQPAGEGDEVAGQVDPNYVPILPFTEEQERKRQQLELKYQKDDLGLAIDSIEPEAGPITGETRVLVRGGPFEDMTLLYPRPKCKFGANDRIVEATYVKCHTKPLSMEDKEGKSRDKVSHPVLL